MNAFLSTMLAVEFGPLFEDLRAEMADKPGFGTRPLDGVKHYAWHHTAGPKTQTWRAIRDFHVNTNGWSGIGYHFGIRQGKLAYLGDVNQARACVRMQNHQVICIVFTGNYDEEQPDVADVAIARRLVGILDAFLGRQPSLVGHGQLLSTKCPGKNLQPLVAGMRARASTVDFRKVAWAVEEGQRILEGEGLSSEAAFVGAHYVKDAKGRIT